MSVPVILLNIYRNPYISINFKRIKRGRITEYDGWITGDLLDCDNVRLFLSGRLLANRDLCEARAAIRTYNIRERETDVGSRWWNTARGWVKGMHKAASVERE